MSQWFFIIWQARAKGNRDFDACEQSSGVMSNGADAARSFELSGVAAGEPTDGSRGARGGGGTDNAASDRSLGRRSGLGARHAKMDPQQSFYAAERTAMFLLCGGSTPQFSFSAVFFYHTKEYCGNSDTTQPDRFLDINTKPQVDRVPAFDVTRQTTTRSSKNRTQLNLR